MTIKFFAHPIFLLIFSFPLFANALTDTILQGQLVTASTTITSSGKEFVLGFFSPGNENSTTSSYLGIWYKRASKKTVVWVANRDNPLTDSTVVLTIAADGNLVIVVGRVSYMLSNISSRGNTSATLWDSGNLVLNDRRSGDILWQSFDYPTDTLLPGMKVGHDKRNGKTWSMLAWKSKEDPGHGVFSFEHDPQGTSQFFILKEFQKYWTSGTWNGKIFTQIPEMAVNYMYDSIYVSNGNESYFTYSMKNPLVTVRFVLDKSGQLQLLLMNETTGEWDMYWAQPREQCDVYGYCGAFGACNRRATAFCQCFRGFQPNSAGNWNAGDMSRGCVRKAPLQCSNYSEVSEQQKDQFLRMSNVRLPDNSIVLSKVRSVGDCESACFSNCSCTAYAYDGNDECSIWREELMNVLQLTDNDPEGRDFYLRLSASESLSEGKDSRIKRWKWIILALAVPIALLAAVSFFYCLRKRKSQNKGEDLVLFDIGTSTGAANCKLNEAVKSRTGKKKDVDLPLFSFASVSAATDNFSDANKLGEGGFGPVYKGKLLKGYEVAVKRLSRKSGQGLEELQNEAMLIAKLQHNNLVRLLGCCIEKDEKILIYECMPNKSLDFFLFDPIRYGILNWELRVNIIEGIAQGLLYLHQYSRLRIIHRDLKASNILLDKDMNPKISDFGMARIFEGNGSHATNRIVGTYGYMSPEYASEGLFSIKSDVFSFGVLLLEILSGKRSTGFYNSDSLNLLGYAWDLWKSGRGEGIKDPILPDIPSTNMLRRYVNIALLCVEESAADRPTMSNVVSMLSNEQALLPSPKQPAFSATRSAPDRYSTNQLEICSVNEVTISILEAR
ncbi:G-type lectin S-receptor-like serine/threonine-protein kinase B120 [Rhododendron vialii]|uniref:G-type lectin S-receptor-like serine/threonine-protein kinase B120 n=1 Tax=Rhododendron vialii TaxID=182163 RepID=UPI00265DF322|nr:G-type lectin S-receptor-like serine/threonine-protein kinase B120 [Rhododendron vialii]